MLYAIQDGPDFYVFEYGSEEPHEVVHSPYTFVDDFDMESADAARAWFVAQRPDVEMM